MPPTRLRRAASESRRRRRLSAASDIFAVVGERLWAGRKSQSLLSPSWAGCEDRAADRLGRLPRLGGGHAEGIAVSKTLKKVAHAVGAHRITTRPFTGHVRVERDGRVLAASDRAVALDETGLPTRFYLPRDDVRMDLLAPSETASHCPFKGDATYASASGAKDAFWVYESPSEEDALPSRGCSHPGPVASTSSSTASRSDRGRQHGRRPPRCRFARHSVAAPRGDEFRRSA
jgi:uncharacterized protein (DUF427 family)